MTATMHSHKHLRVAVFAFVACAFGSAMGYAQSTDDSEPTLAIPSSKLQVRFDVLGAGYWDFDQATLGHESQGRIAGRSSASQGRSTLISRSTPN